MATEKDLIKFCRYYKGEKEPPKYDDSGKRNLWNAERVWIDVMRDDKADFSAMLQEYNRYGLAEFSMNDGVPLTLKSVLFNRFAQHNEQFNVNDFKDWYLRKYLK